MAKGFLQVNKELFELGLAPIDILVLAQIEEFNRTTGDCFMSDKAMAEQFGVSESTVSRSLKVLESKKLIVRETKNVKGGKERHIKPTTSKMTVDDGHQASKRSLSSIKMTVDNKQNDLIKENIKEKEKENNIEYPSSPEGAEEYSRDSYPEVKMSKLIEMKCRFEELGEGLVKICDTNKIFRVGGQE